MTSRLLIASSSRMKIAESTTVQSTKVPLSGDTDRDLAALERGEEHGVGDAKHEPREQEWPHARAHLSQRGLRSARHEQVDAEGDARSAEKRCGRGEWRHAAIGGDPTRDVVAHREEHDARERPCDADRAVVGRTRAIPDDEHSAADDQQCPE